MAAIKVGVNPEDVDVAFPVAPPDTYPCSITSQEAKQSKKDKPMIVFGLTPTVPIKCAVGEKEKEISGKELFKLYVSLAPNALFSLKILSAACGNVGWRGGEVFPEEFLGRVVKAQISKNTDDNGKAYNRVENLFAA